MNPGISAFAARWSALLLCSITIRLVNALRLGLALLLAIPARPETWDAVNRSRLLGTIWTCRPGSHAGGRDATVRADSPRGKVLTGAAWAWPALLLPIVGIWRSRRQKWKAAPFARLACQA